MLWVDSPNTCERLMSHSSRILYSDFVTNIKYLCHADRKAYVQLAEDS